jgi:NADH:ubiquinone oxidoreductase subunit K
MLLVLLIPSILFIVGILGIFFSRKNLILVIISLELILLALTYHYLMIGWSNFGDLKTVLLGILILTVATSESAIGLILFIAYYKTYRYFN